jgi:hypothetical protein
LARALAWSAALPLVLVCLIPGAAPRYVLPVLAPFCWLMGLTLAQEALAEPAWLKLSERSLWKRIGVPFVALAVVIGLIGYPVASIYMRHRQKVKNKAAEINAVVPKSETLYAIDPNYQPLFFYIAAPVKYVNSIEELPYETRYFLVRPDNEQNALASEQWSPRRAHPVIRVKDYRKQVVILFTVDPS